MARPHPGIGTSQKSCAIMCVYLDWQTFSRENTTGVTPGNQDKSFLTNIPIRELPVHPGTHSMPCLFSTAPSWLQALAGSASKFGIF